jgi:nitrite reductase/ring-hydroxylating ferredoxin subunit
MVKLFNDPHQRGVDTHSPIPPVTHDNPTVAHGDRLIGLEQLDDRRVAEVRTEHAGVLAVGVTPGGEPFAVSNVCRHQFAKLGRGRVTDSGCLECPWHRARYDVSDGTMVEGPKGRVFGFKPYSSVVKAAGGAVKLKTFPVEIRDGAIFLTRQ